MERMAFHHTDPTVGTVGYSLSPSGLEACRFTEAIAKPDRRNRRKKWYFHTVISMVFQLMLGCVSAPFA